MATGKDWLQKAVSCCEQVERLTELGDAAGLAQLAMLQLRVAEVVVALETAERLAQSVRDNKAGMSYMTDLVERLHPEREDPLG